ncbi:MAG TPA: serine hydrolase domain-containing protein [Polyangiaceae bacterium]|nr:serine hydrolase domain-containing protein [Polyangiaceae bacterium]
MLVASGCSSEPRGASQTSAAGEAPNTPEAQGIDSNQLASVIDQIVAQHLDVHSLTVFRHGHVVLDADFFPYDGRRRHDFASCTKALTTTALGIALDDGSIPNLDQALLSYFPDTVVDNDSTDKRAMTLAQAASMTSGFDCVNQPNELTLIQMQAAPDWMKFALGVPMAGPPGTEWRYCSTAMHILSGVIGHVTGQAEDDFLAERLFAPIGASRPEWPRDPQGNTHGWGDARLWPKDMLRVAQVFLGQGTFGTQRIVDSSFVAEATSNRAGDLGPPNGYGYAWWTTSGKSYYAQGRGGQLVLIAPVRGAILVVTGAQSSDQTQSLNDLVNELGAKLSDSPLPPDPEAVRKLSAEVTKVSEPPAAEAVPPPPDTASTVSGRTYALASNMFGWDSVELTFAESEATLTLAMGSTKTTAKIGLDAVARITRDAQFSTDPRYADIDIAMSGKWTADDTFVVTFDTIDTIDAGTMSFVFQNDDLTVSIFEKTFLLSTITFGGQAKR